MLQPDIETLMAAAQPLELLRRAGAIDPAPFDRAALQRRTKTEVFILAGRWDHVVDYRGATALAASYPRAQLFIADDSHVFPRMVESGAYNALLQAFLLHGPDSPAMADAFTEAAPHRWQD